MDFSISIKEQNYTNRVKKFIYDKVKPNISEWYDTKRFSPQIFKELYKANLMGFHEMNNRWGSRPNDPYCNTF